MTEALRQAAQAALDALESDAIQRTFAGGVRMSNAAIALRAALAQPPAPTAQAAPVNGIKATMFHDEGAIAQCQGCKRYSLDPNTLHQSDSKQPVCECGKQHYWSGSFVKPGPDAKWHGKEPVAQPVQQPGAEPVACWGVEACVNGAWTLQWPPRMTREVALADRNAYIPNTLLRVRPLYFGAAPAQRQPLSEVQIHAMKCAAADQGITGIAPSLHLARAVEAAHGITAATAAQKGEKL